MTTGLKYYFGIDFGTTNSATVGYVVMDQKPEAVKYGDEEGRPIPSVVAIDKTTGAVFNGRDAWDKKMELTNFPQNWRLSSVIIPKILYLVLVLAVEQLSFS